jgi:hypothetical protein
VIGVLEALSLVGQFSVPELFTSRVRKFEDFLDGGVFHGAYATRAHGALTDLVELLARDPDTRQAVITVFDSTRDLNRAKRDIPCTIALHFARRGERLDLKVIMRSNDLWLGTPYDFTQFAVLQASVAQVLGLTPGKYVHSVGSLHLYERDLARAKAVRPAATTSAMAFPLWSVEPAPSPVERLASVVSRARQLAFDPVGFRAATGFEQWAQQLLLQ